MILTTSTIWSTTGSQEAPATPSELNRSRANVEAESGSAQVRPPKRAASLPPAPPLRVIRTGSIDHTDGTPIVASTSTLEATPIFRTQRAVPIMSIIADDQKRRRLEPARPTQSDEDVEPMVECQKSTGSTAQSQLRELLQASRLRRLELQASEQLANTSRPTGAGPIVIAPGAQRAGASARFRIFQSKTLEPGHCQEPVELGNLIDCDVPIITLTELDDFTFEERMTRQLTLSTLTHVSSLPVRPPVPCWMRPNVVLDGPNAVRSPVEASGHSNSIRMSSPSRGPINKRLLCPPPADARGRANFHGRWWSRKNMGYDRPAPRRTQSCSGISLPTLNRLAAASAARRSTLDGRSHSSVSHLAGDSGPAPNLSSTDFKIITTLPSDTAGSHQHFQMGPSQVHFSVSDKSLADETLEELGNVLSQALPQGGHRDLHLNRLGPKRVPSTFASRTGTREVMSPLETLQLVLDAQQRLQETYSEGHPVPLPMHELSSRRGAVSGSSYSLIASSQRRDSQDSEDSVSEDGGLSSSSGSDSESESGEDEARDVADSSLADDFDSILVVDQESTTSTGSLFARGRPQLAKTSFNSPEMARKMPARPLLTRGSHAYARS